MRGHFARVLMKHKYDTRVAKRGDRRSSLSKRMSTVRVSFDSVKKAGAAIKAASAFASVKTKKMTLREAALNVKFMNMLLNRTFLRSRVEKKEMENAVRSNFLCFEGVGDMFLEQLLAAAVVTNLQPGDLVTVQGERVARFFVVVSGSIGKHAAFESM